MKKRKNAADHFFIFYFLIALLLEIFLGRSQNQRYLTPFVTFLIIPASYVFSTLWKSNVLKKSLVIVSFLIPLILSFMVVINPDFYIMQLAKVSKYSNVEHARGQMSGYQIKEVMNYLREHASPSQPTMVFIALNSGNPENAIDVYAQKDPNLYVLHLDGKMFTGLEQVDCLTSAHPAFFVTRYDQRVDLDRYFSVLEKTFPNPDGKYWISIYTLKKNCKGKTVSLSDIYQPTMDTMLQIRSGLAN